MKDGTGAGHGGYGGSPQGASLPGGEPYGDFREPDRGGSRGGNGTTAVGGAGGGYVNITLIGTAIVDGKRSKVPILNSS